MKDENFEPQWLKDAAESMLKNSKENYENEDQNDLMQLIDKNTEDQL